MGRKRKIQEDQQVTNATVTIPTTEWEAFKERADSMKMTRSDLIRAIATGSVKIQEEQIQTGSGLVSKQVLGKSLSVSRLSKRPTTATSVLIKKD